MEQTEQSSIISLAKRVSELAELQTSHGSVPQGDFVQAVRRLQVAVEGPAHYVARMRNQVRDHIVPTSFDHSLLTRQQPTEYIGIILAIESGVLQALVGTGGKPLSAQELAVKTKADPLLISK